MSAESGRQFRDKKVRVRRGAVRHGLIDRALRKVALFVAIGTSGMSIRQPDSSRRRAPMACEPARSTSRRQTMRLFDEQRLGRASETVPVWVEEIVGL